MSHFYPQDQTSSPPPPFIRHDLNHFDNNTRDWHAQNYQDAHDTASIASNLFLQTTAYSTQHNPYPSPTTATFPDHYPYDQSQRPYASTSSLYGLHTPNSDYTIYLPAVLPQQMNPHQQEYHPYPSHLLAPIAVRRHLKAAEELQQHLHNNSEYSSPSDNNSRVEPGWVYNSGSSGHGGNTTDQSMHEVLQYDHLPNSTVRPFIGKLSSIANNAQYEEIITWDASGTILLVLTTDKNHRLANEILPTFYAHASASAFHRQLNLYGFKHISKAATAAILLGSPDYEHYDLKAWRAWSHPMFRKAETTSLHLMKPKPSRARRELKEANLWMERERFERGEAKPKKVKKVMNRYNSGQS